MTIDKLADNRVLIVLCKQDMNDFSLDYSKMKFEDSRTRRVLMRILRLACVKEGIEINGKKVFLEAINFDDECYLLATINGTKQKKYRLKSNKNSLCYHLGNSGNFLDAIEQLYRQNVCCNHNSAYMYNDEYYLIFDYPSIPQKLRRVLSEYGNKGKNSIITARVKENGKQLCKQNAIAQIGKYLI